MESFNDIQYDQELVNALQAAHSNTKALGISEILFFPYTGADDDPIWYIAVIADSNLEQNLKDAGLSSLFTEVNRFVFDWFQNNHPERYPVINFISQAEKATFLPS